MSQGVAGGRGGDNSLCVEGGCVLAATESWCHRLDDVIHDGRGWGRYVGRVIRGTSGKAVVVVTVLGPEGEALKKQQAQLPQLVVEQVPGVVPEGG